MILAAGVSGRGGPVGSWGLVPSPRHDGRRGPVQLPVLFAVERGQADPLVIVPIIVAAWLLRRCATWADLACGATLGATAWLKYYPGLCVGPWPIALNRKKLLAAFVVVAALIGIG